MGSNPTAAPVSAIINGPMNIVDITFEPDIVDDPVIDTGNWTVRWNNINRVVTAASIVGDSVRLLITAGGADPGINRVDYAPPPNDVLTTDGGNKVLPFTDFPVTM